jgi:hypothetical protein
MKNAIRSYCTLFVLTTSAAFSQSMPDGNAQTPATASATPAMAGMSGDSTTEAGLQKMETELAQADAVHDTAPFEKYIDDNIVALGPGWKAMGKAQVMEAIKDTTCSTTNPTLSGFSYKWLSPDIVLVSYLENATNTCKGKATQLSDHDSSLWQKKNGQWMAVFHQATADMPSTMTGGS